METAVETLEKRTAVPEARLPSDDRVANMNWPKRIQLLAAFVVLVLGVVTFVLIRTWPVLFSRPMPQVVSASGRIEGREVTLAVKTIQGRVKRLLADEGQTVTKGQLLAELDAAQIDAQVAAAEATVGNLDAQIRQASLDVAFTAKKADASISAADAALNSAHAHVVRAKAILVNATAAYERTKALFNDGAVSKQDLDAAEMMLHTTRADVAAAEKDVVHAEANLALANASTDTIGLKRQQRHALEGSRRTAVARLEEAQANQAERLITAPENGTIVSRPVEVGDVVSPGSPIFQVVDMTRLYVKVYVPEPDIAKLRLGDAAEVFVDAFPGRSFAARISKIYDQAEFTPKNVETADERLKLVFGIELALRNTDGVLKPGMPADCVIHWAPPRADDDGDGS